MQSPPFHDQLHPRPLREGQQGLIHEVRRTLYVGVPKNFPVVSILDDQNKPVEFRGSYGAEG